MPRHRSEAVLAEFVVIIVLGINIERSHVMIGRYIVETFQSVSENTDAGCIFHVTCNVCTLKNSRSLEYRCYDLWKF